MGEMLMEKREPPTPINGKEPDSRIYGTLIQFSPLREFIASIFVRFDLSIIILILRLSCY